MKPEIHHPDYLPAAIRRIRRDAMRKFRAEGRVRVSHIRPRAYCVAKELCWATFAVPPCDNEPQVRGTQFIGVLFGEDAQVGRWYSLAYVFTEERGGGTRLINGPL